MLGGVEIGLRSECGERFGWVVRLLRVKYMCDQKCNEEGLRSCDIAVILVEVVGKPHTISLCGNYHNLRLTESDEAKVTNALWRDMSE